MRNHYKYKNKLPKHFTKKRPLYLNNVRKPIKAMWPVKTLIAVSLLLTLILVVPTIVVIPFIKQQDPIQAVTEKLNNTWFPSQSKIHSLLFTFTAIIVQHSPLKTLIVSALFVTVASYMFSVFIT